MPELSRKYRVFVDGDYSAACHRLEDAVMVAMANGEGSQVRTEPSRKTMVYTCPHSPVSYDLEIVEARLALAELYGLEAPK
jgi:hypothetical protein